MVKISIICQLLFCGSVYYGNKYIEKKIANIATQKYLFGKEPKL